nr:MAG TPA: hypothetical protein [Caudoviricetes sp.]
MCWCRHEPISQSIIRSLIRSMTARHQMIQLKQRNGTPNLVITLQFWEVMTQFVKMAHILHLHRCCKPKTGLCHLWRTTSGLIWMLWQQKRSQ